MNTFPKICAFFFAGLVLLCAAPRIEAFPIYGVSLVSGEYRLVRFDSTTPGTIDIDIPITGLQPTELIQGIDFRPATTQLYALGTIGTPERTYRLYIINTTTGAATLVGSPGTVTLVGSNFGFDFDPVADRVRVVSNADENILINPNDGTASAEGALAYKLGDPNVGENPNVVGAAYTDSKPGATFTALFGIDVTLDILTIQTPPETGRLSTAGSLGLNTSVVIGFDFATTALGNTGYASLTVASVTGLYTISTGDGTATLVGVIGNGSPNLVDMTVSLEPQTFVVTSTADPGDGVCNASCTLREAITAADDKPGADIINFNIPGIGGTLTVTPTSALPSIRDQVTIDGYTQPGAAANTLGVGNNAVLRIQLNGANAGDVPGGLVIKGANCIIRGLIVNRWMNAGILIDGVTANGVTNNRITGNFIGTNSTGTVALGNDDGVEITAAGNIVGGTTPAARNLISGNTGRGISLSNFFESTNNLIQGNYIGTDKNGTAALGNGTSGVVVAGSGNQLGTPGAGNVIADNGSYGVNLNGSNNVAQGNFIGTDATGTVALGNKEGGVLMNSGSDNTVGGSTPGTGNVISGNTGTGGNGNGVYLIVGTNNRVLGNYIGTDATGLAQLGNQSSGVRVTSDNNFVGGTVAGEGNLISSNNTGISVDGIGTSGNRVEGNRIGLAADGSPLGNGTGVFLRQGSTDTTVGGPGGGNTIAFNAGSGVAVDTSEGNDITGNSIFSNGQLGIDLKGGTQNASLVTANDPLDGDTGPNRLQNYPVLTGITGSGSTRAMAGQLNSAANTAYVIDFYRNDAVDPSGFGEGQTFMGFVNVQTNGQGTATFSFPLDNSANGQFITATATDSTGNTSEFSMASSVVPGPAPTPTPTPTATPTPVPARLANISTRLRVETGDNVLIGGFIITGSQAKKVIVRGIGTSLPFADRLGDPTLELRDSSGALIDSNDNWVDSPNKQAIIDSAIPPSSDLESAIVAILPANGSGYTAIVRGVSDGTGIGVVEAYDLDSSVDSKLANISTRGLVQTGDNVLIAGTIILGQTTQRIIVRAIGPSLPVAGKLQDPTLELRDANGALIRSNDNWRTGGQETEIIQSGVPPTNDFESAIVETLSGNGASYTAIVRGGNNTTGVAVVEVYALN